jgi:hypothetical protein
MVANATTAMDRILGGLMNSLSTDAAENVVELKLDAETQALLDRLADKSASGTLTGDERAEYLEMVEAIDFVAVFQAKARDVVNRRIGK